MKKKKKTVLNKNKQFLEFYGITYPLTASPTAS